MKSNEATKPFDTYEAYATLLSIAKGIVKNSEGMGLNKFNKEQILKDIEEADGIARTAKSYWEASSEAAGAKKKLAAAMILGLDTAGYEETAGILEREKDYWIEKMREIIESGRYIKSHYHGGWKKV